MKFFILFFLVGYEYDKVVSMGFEWLFVYIEGGNVLKKKIFMIVLVVVEV